MTFVRLSLFFLLSLTRKKMRWIRFTYNGISGMLRAIPDQYCSGSMFSPELSIWVPFNRSTWSHGQVRGHKLFLSSVLSSISGLLHWQISNFLFYLLFYSAIYAWLVYLWHKTVFVISFIHFYRNRSKFWYFVHIP